MAIKNETPLLADELSTPERVMLGQTTTHGGYKIIIKLMEAACTRATQDTVRLDPEESDYERKLSVRTQRARNIIEFSALVLKSIDWHVNAVQTQAAEEQQGAEAAVAKTFGIHTVPPKPKKEAEQK